MIRSSAEDRRIRSLRPARQAVDPWQPIAVIVERERRAVGVARVATLFLAGAECPFTCIFCDLWRHTLEGLTPQGAIVAQIERSLSSVAGLGIERLKLYNASNFFDRRAVPEVDDAAILRLIAPFSRATESSRVAELSGVTVECHPRLLGRRFERYAEVLGGRLEVALGLETAHPGALARLNKGVTLDDFDRAVERILEAGALARAFVLVGLPWLAPHQQLEWVVRSVDHALRRGVGVVSLIPLRGGNGEMERLAATGEWSRPSLSLLERSFEAVLGDPRGVVQVDPWDLDRLACCRHCGPARRRRLARMSLCGESESAVVCADRCQAAELAG